MIVTHPRNPEAPCPAIPAKQVSLCVLATGLSPVRNAFLDALCHSLTASNGSRKATEIVLIGESDVEVVAARHGVDQVLSPGGLLGCELDPYGIWPWYLEQMLALTFAAEAHTPFSLVLPIGSFAVAPFDVSTLLPEGLALTTNEPMEYHRDWWSTARDWTHRTPSSSYAGPSILPAILSKELAAWTLEIVTRENGQDAVQMLYEASQAHKAWSAMSLYTTAAGSRIDSVHTSAAAAQARPLLVSETLWSNSAITEFDPAKTCGDAKKGIFTYVQADAITEVDVVLDRLYCTLR